MSNESFYFDSSSLMDPLTQEVGLIEQVMVLRLNKDMPRSTDLQTQIWSRIWFFDPPTLGGWSCRFTAVRQSLCQLVCNKFFSETNLRIPQLFGIKVACKKVYEVTMRYFPKKLFGPNFGILGPNVPKFEIFDIFSGLEFQISLILLFLTDKHDI